MEKNKHTIKIKVMKKSTRKNYLLLKDLYPSMVIDKNIHEHKNNTYGEMEYSGIKKLFASVKVIDPKLDTFIDIGSGRGKICMAMAMYSQIKKIIGIEMIEERHNDANKLKKKLDKEYTKKITFIHNDVLNIDLNIGSKAFIWFSNLCIDQETANTIFLKLQNELPGSILCCSKEPSINIGHLLDSINIEMSWIENSNVKIYRIKNKNEI